MDTRWIVEQFQDDHGDFVVAYPVSEVQLHMLEGCTCFCKPAIELFETGIAITHNRLEQS